MGYFKRKPDRGRSRELVRKLNEDGARSLAWERIPERPTRRTRYLRFSTFRPHECSGRRMGVFHAAYDLLREERVDPDLRRRVRTLLDWFNVYLPAPAYLNEARAVFFFKTDVGRTVDRVWELAFELRDAGLLVEMQTLKRPGKIVYEDDYQVAVVPWRGVTTL